MESYMRAACATEIKDVGEKALFHALELLRLDATESKNVRYTTPFILLNVQRDDDAFDFIRFMMNLNGASEDVAVELLRRHEESQEGNWMYPREKNCRFLDAFEECPHVDDCFVTLAYLVALIIVKLRIVAAYDATRRAIDSAFETSGGQSIQEVHNILKDMLIDESLVNIDSQRQQVERLVNAIHRNNPSMLPAILNPRPLLTQKRPVVMSPGSPSDAFFVLL